MSAPAWHVREAGDPARPAVVLVHGAGLSGRMWAPHVARLAAFRCLAPDLPGCGHSRGIPWVSLTDAADGLAALIEARIPSGRAHVVGISVGGAVTHALLARHPGVVDRVLIDGAGVLPSWRDVPLRLSLAAIAPLLHTSAVIGMLSRSVGQMPEEARADLRIASRRAFRRSYAEALEAMASPAEVRATAPTLLVAGERETSVRRSNAALATLMPNATARYVPGLGHGWLGRRLDLHVATVEAWLTGQPLPSGLAEEHPWPAAVRRLGREIARSG